MNIYEKFSKNLLCFVLTCEQYTGNSKEIAVQIAKFTEEEKYSFMDYVTSKWLAYFESIMQETYKYVWFTEDVFNSWKMENKGE